MRQAAMHGAESTGSSHPDPQKESRKCIGDDRRFLSLKSAGSDIPPPKRAFLLILPKQPAT